MAGWRWVTLGSSLRAIFVWWIRPERPGVARWLANCGRVLEAEQAESAIDGLACTEYEGQTSGKRYRPQRRNPACQVVLNFCGPPIARRNGHLVLAEFLSSYRLLWVQQLDPSFDGIPRGRFVKSLNTSFVTPYLFHSPFGFRSVADRLGASGQVVIASASVAVFGLAFFATVHGCSDWSGSEGCWRLSNLCFPIFTMRTSRSCIRLAFVPAHWICYSFSRLSTVLHRFMIRSF